MTNYKVMFFRDEFKENEKTGKMEKTDKSDYLGHVAVDDTGTESGKMTLVSKAWRHAPVGYLAANRTRVELS